MQLQPNLGIGYHSVLKPNSIPTEFDKGEEQKIESKNLKIYT